MSDTPLGKWIIEKSDKSGNHTSRSDDKKHRTIKNADGEVTGHYYEDGSIKGVGGRGGSLAWLTGIPKRGS